MPSKPPPGSRPSFVEGIASPLGFFVLALLIVEAFLATVLVGAQLTETGRMVALWSGVAMFVLVVGMVFALVWFKPQNITFTMKEHMERLRRAAKSDSPQPAPVAKKKPGTRPPAPSPPSARKGETP